MEEVIVTLPTDKWKVQMPGPGCRQLTVKNICQFVTKAGEKRVHVDFAYKGYVFGQTFNLDNPVLRVIFGDEIKMSRIGMTFFAEVDIKYSQRLQKEYPEVIGVETIS